MVVAMEQYPFFLFVAAATAGWVAWVVLRPIVRSFRAWMEYRRNR